MTQTTTQQIKQILQRTLENLPSHKLGSDTSLHVFLFSVHDWFAHLVGKPYWWNDYGTTIKQVLLSQIGDTNTLIQDWADQCVSAPLNMQTLLNRHYLCQAVLAQEIHPRYNTPSIYAIKASMMTKEIVFTPLSQPSLWEGIDLDPYPINALRLKRPLILRYFHQLSMREDETDYRLLRDHGVLSSASLLYGLYLIRVILIYEMTIKPDHQLNDILNSLSETLTQVKGVLYHVQSDWLSVDV